MSTHGLLSLSKDITSKPHAVKLHESCIKLPADIRILVMCFHVWFSMRQESIRFVQFVLSVEFLFQLQVG
jgi:hypothetical protein